MRPGTLCSAALVAIASLTLMSAEAAAGRNAAAPKVEVVFVLDTTGSMGGLLQGAKQKIWSIVNEIAKGQPTPDIRLGLIGYRDKGDAYITTRTDLTTDLDAVYEKLMAFQAAGGGDGPEHVNQAMHEAVHRMSWSAGRRVLKVVFLVGDAPPHMDYQDDVKYPETLQQAMRRDLIVNTILCGNNTAARRTWQDIARKAEGRFVAIAQSGGTVAVATPYDAELAALSRRLEATHLSYGSVAEREAVRAKMKRSRAVMAEAAPEAAASRAAYKARAGAVGRGRDLVADVASGEADLDAMGDAELPAELQGKSAAERKKLLEKKQTERRRLSKQIAELSSKRDAFVKEKLAEKGAVRDSFDAQVIESIRSKAAKKGIRY